MKEIVAEPLIVKSHDVTLDAEYAEWIAEVKHRYRSAQVKAAVKVNAEKLLWNWQMGRDLVQKKAEERWGAGVVEQVSLDLQKEFPGEKGFSTTNLWYMKKWYLYYTADEAIQRLEQTVDGLFLMQNQKDTIIHQLGGEIEARKLHQAGGEFPIPFALVPWKHHVEIITKCETIEKA
jgi:predicted nuclease of restriction endonuclease-like (RecB) superfamily